MESSIDLAALSTQLRKISARYLSMGHTSLPAFNGMKYADAAQLLSTAGSSLSQRAIGLWASALIITTARYHDPSEALQDAISRGKALLVEALQCDPAFCPAYCDLVGCLSGSESVTLHDGRTLDGRQLYLEALRVGDHIPALIYLGDCLSSTETITLPDGRTLNSRQLYLEALQRTDHDADVDCDDLALRKARAYNGLGVCLFEYGAEAVSVTLHDGRTLSRRQLFVEALKYENCDQIYRNLGCCLNYTETVALHDGRTLNRLQLFVEALRYANSDLGSAAKLCKYIGSCLHISGDETVTLHDGRTLNLPQLYAENLYYNYVCGRSDAEPDSCYLPASYLRFIPSNYTWNRTWASSRFGGGPAFAPTNVLFATLLLGLQRLETSGGLPPAHHSMLEDMLEGWTWGDTKDLS